MQVSRGGYTSKLDIPLPDKCMVVYANINPVSGRKALRLFQNKVMDMMFNERDDDFELYNMSKMDTLLMNCYQKSRGVRKFIDVDFDIPELGIDIVRNFLGKMQNHGVKYYVIKTKSGFHVLLEKETIKYNYNKDIKFAHDLAQSRFGQDHVEVIQNKNEMVPVPGTYQAGCVVQMLEM